MASRLTTDVQTLEKRPIVITGSFAPNGSSALVAADTIGKGFTVAYTSTGLYTVTVPDRFNALISAQVSLQLATGADRIVQFGTISAVTSASWTAQIRCWDISDAAVADIAANANNRIHFTFFLKNSSI